ncbi:hemolysin family protein [Rhodothermus marinus]|uniref:CBS domain containing protein n=2 Tax=Rhodothermus marinus TaxID=29549 RepID=D0MD79_RHOM4|nr:hemolysin family protein [Rhodothermus marinus]ACY48991.1 CBS domain containing protein [Rhodothermus marinus DSM 4252]
MLFLLISALLSGSEAALLSLRTVGLTSGEATDPAVRRLQELLARPRHLIVTLQLLNTLANVGAALMAVVLAARLAWQVHWPPVLVLLVELLGVALVLLVMGEITPRLLAGRYAEPFARRMAAVVWVLQRALYPVADALVRLSAHVQRRLRAPERPLSPDELKALEVAQDGMLGEDERELLAAILEFGETTVREIMVSRLDIVAIPETATFGEVLACIRTSGHSRLPLYAEHLDNILGIVYAKDLLPYLGRAELDQPLNWRDIARPAMFVPLSKRLDDLLRDFQRRKTHMAIVVDEYGGTAGLVTLEDVLEEIVGDIRDEHDETEPVLYEQLDEHTYRVDARMNLDDLAELLGIELDTESFDFETLGGLIFHLLGVIPEPGDEVQYGPLHLRVETVDNHRIGQVLVRVEPTPVAVRKNGAES